MSDTAPFPGLPTSGHTPPPQSPLFQAHRAKKHGKPQAPPTEQPAAPAPVARGRLSLPPAASTGPVQTTSARDTWDRLNQQAAERGQVHTLGERMRAQAMAFGPQVGPPSGTSRLGRPVQGAPAPAASTARVTVTPSGPPAVGSTDLGGADLASLGLDSDWWKPPIAFVPQTEESPSAWTMNEPGTGTAAQGFGKPPVPPTAPVLFGGKPTPGRHGNDIGPGGRTVDTGGAGAGRGSIPTPEGQEWRQGGNPKATADRLARLLGLDPGTQAAAQQAVRDTVGAQRGAVVADLEASTHDPVVLMGGIPGHDGELNARELLQRIKDELTGQRTEMESRLTRQREIQAELDHQERVRGVTDRGGVGHRNPDAEAGRTEHGHSQPVGTSLINDPNNPLPQGYTPPPNASDAHEAQVQQELADQERRRGRTEREHPRIAIVGSRGYPNPEHVTDYVNSLPDNTTVISGGARGVDRTAAAAARARGLAVEVYPADWNGQGRGAGMARNQQIVDTSDQVVAFWDGQSPGTRHAIDRAQQAGKPHQVIRPGGSAGPFPTPGGGQGHLFDPYQGGNPNAIGARLQQTLATLGHGIAGVGQRLANNPAFNRAVDRAHEGDGRLSPIIDQLVRRFPWLFR
jgi:hypothetical protein